MDRITFGVKKIEEKGIKDKERKKKERKERKEEKEGNLLANIFSNGFIE